MIRQSVSVILLLCVATALSVPTNTNDGVLAVSNGANLFSTNFYKTLDKSKNENLVVSPLSVSVALSMLSYGARGNTANQLKASLHIPQDESVSKSGFQGLVDNLNSAKNVVFRLANKIYTHSGFSVKPDFVSLTQTYFRSAAESLDFTNSEVAASTINNWVKNQTKDKINEIVSPDDLQDAVMFLFNAVYFKGEWETKFYTYKTMERPFHVDANTVKQVPTMYHEDNYKYGEIPEVNASFVVIPYKGEDVNMVIILPNQINGLPELEKNLEKINIYDIVDKTNKRNVKLYLPKFKIENELNLKEPLKQLGMDEMFTKHANLLGISDIPIVVSDAVHKTIIEVNEHGTEAAAATKLQAELAMISFAKSVKVDRPFFFTIYQQSSRQGLFQGHVYQPTF